VAARKREIPACGISDAQTRGLLMTNTEAIKIIIRIIDQIVNEPEPTGQIVIDINREVKHIRRTYDIEPEREKHNTKI